MRKRLFSLLLMFFAALAVHAALDVRLSEKFESGSIPATWTQEVMSDDTCLWIIDTQSTYPTGAHTGSGRAAMRNTTGTTHGYITRLITPQLNLESTANFQVSFAYAQAQRKIDSTYTWDYLKVYSFDGSKWTLLESYENAYQNTWTEVVLDLPGQPVYLAFEANDHDGRGVVLDDVKVYKKSTCADVVSFGAQAGSNSATIFYQKDAGSKAQLLVDTVEHTMSELLDSIPAARFFYTETTDDQVDLTGLDSQRKYYAYIRTICDDNESGYTNWVSMSFTTAVGFPFFEGFTGGALPTNWQNLYGSVEDAFKGTLPVKNTNSTYIWKYSTNTTVTGSTHAVGQPHYVYSGGYVYTPTWFVSPTIDLTDVTDPAIELSFKLSMSSSATYASEITSGKDNYKFMVLISMDGGASWSAADATTFEGSTLSATAQRKRVNLTGYKGNSITIAFVAVGSGTSAYFHLDDVKVDTFDPQCGGVSKVTISDLTDMSAIVNWVISGKDSVVVQMAKYSSFTTLLKNDTIAPADHKLLLDGLDGNTTYYVRVKQLCEDADWATANFTTALGLDYLNKFTSTTWPSDWKRYQGVAAESVFNGASLGTAASSGWSAAATTIEGMGGYAAKFNLYGAAKYNWMVSPAIYLNPASATNVELRMVRAITKYNAATTAPSFTDTDDQYIVMVSEDAGATWLRANAIIWDCLDSTVGYLEHHDLRTVTADPEVVTINLTSMIGKTIQVAVYAGSTTSGSDNDVFAGNITVKRFDPNCAGIEKIVLSADIHDAKAKWSYKGTQAAIAQLATNTAFTEGLISDTITLDSIVYTGLQANTKYYFRVMQNCDLGAWSDVKNFTTHCEADTIPYQYGFDDATSAGTPSCWTLIQDANKYPQVGATSSNAKTGSKYLSWGGTSYMGTAGISFAALPAFETAVNQTEMSFWIRNASSYYNGDTIEIGVMTNPMDASTFVKITQVVASTTSYEQCFVSFVNYAGEGQYIAFKRLNGNKYAVYIDDIVVHALPACHRMGDVTTSSITSTGATIKFEQTNADNFQIVLTTEPINPDTLDQVSADKIAYNQVLPYASQLVISDAAIQPNTLYYIYVRGICSDEEKGAWSLPASFTTLCAAVTPAAYGVETFDNVSNMACWTTGFLTPGTSTDYTKAGRNTSNNYGAYLELSKKSANSTSYTYSDGAYAISPELDIDSINKYQITFSAATFSQEAINVARVEIGIVTNPSDMDTYEKIKTISLTYAADSAAAAKPYPVDFKSYAGDYLGEFGKYVMLKSVAGTDSTNYVLIDNVSFQVASSCPQIIETSVDSVGLNSAVFHFENVGAAQYEVLVSTINTRAVDTLSTSVIREITSTNSLALTGLNASTQYYAYVRAICGEGDTANWSASTAFMTKFGVPYTDLFNAAQFNGWEVYSSSAFSSADSILGSAFSATTSTNKWSLVSASSSSYATGLEGNVARSYIPWTSGTNMWLVSPTIDMTANEGQNIQLSFKVARSDVSSSGAEAAASSDCSGYKFYVVVSTDEGATWKKADATSWLTDGSGDYDYKALNGTAQEIKLGLSQYAGKSIRLAFYTESNGSPMKYNYIFVDNVKVYTYEAVCQGIKKFQIDANGLEAKATWEIEGTPVKSIVELSKASDFATVMSSDTIQDSLSFTFSSGLEMNNTYYVRVKQADCEDAEWQIKSFKTPLGLPYSETFNSTTLSADWSVMTGSVADAYAGKLPTTTTSTNTNSWGIYTNSHGLPANHLAGELYNLSSYNQKWAMSPVINMTAEAGTEIQCSFDMAYTYYSSAKAPSATVGQTFMMLVSEDGGATWTKANTWIWNDTLTGAYDSIANIPVDGKTYTFDFSQYINKSIQVAFYKEAVASDNHIHIANFNIKPLIAGCDDPTELTLDSVSTNMAIVSWQGDSAKVSVVEYSTSGSFDTNVLRDTIEAGLTDTIFELLPATKYFVRVQQLCDGDAKTGYTNVVNLLTECEVLTITKEQPYVMNFDNETAGTKTIPVCWTADRDGGNYPTVFTTSYYSHSGSQILSFGGSSGVNKVSYAILPEFSNDVNKLQMNFFLSAASSSYASDSIYIGVMTDPEDLTTFVPVKGFQTAAASYVECEVWFNNYTGTGHYIAIKRVPVEDGYGYYTYYYGSYIDDVTVSLLPTCYKIEDLKASALSHSAKISHKASNAGQYELIVTSKAINPDTIATVADSIIMHHATAADTAINVADLKAQTKYYVYLRGVCGSTDMGAWATTNFTTMCDAQTVGATTPYVMDFEDEMSSTIPSCWSKLGNSSYPYVTTGTGATGSKYLYYGGYYGDYETTYTILPEFTNDINKLQLNFSLKGYSSYAYNDSIVIGVMSDPTDTTTFLAMQGFRAQNSSAWVACEVLFDQYAGQGHFIAVKRIADKYYYGSMLDDFTVSLMPTCPLISSIKASNVSRREFDLTWTPKVTTEGQHYDFVMSKTQLNETQLEVAAKQDLDTAFFHASGLDRETNYYIYVRANCGAEDGVGAWANLTVKTKGLNACEELIIADGTATNSYVPVYGSYVDDPQRSQSIYPAAMLTELAGQQITALKYFVTSGSSTSWGSKDFTVRLAEVEEADLSTSFVSASMTDVYTGTLTASVENGMVIEFAEPFEYNGGNLLVEFDLPVDQSGYTACTFAGMNATNASRNAYGSTYLTASGTLRDFLPKVAMSYCYSVEACPTVDSISHELTGEGTTSAHIAWSAGAGDYANTYDLLISDTAVVDFSAVVPTADSLAVLSYDVTNLAAYTDYFVYVRVNCDAESKQDGRSGWSEAYEFKTNSACRVITDLNFEATGKTTALATWKATAQDNNFQYILSEVALSKEDLEIATPTASALADTFAILSGLTSGQKYFLYVANSCGEEGTSPYIADSLQMPAGCPAVADLQTTYEAFNAVSLKWGRGAFGEENQWLAGIQGDASRTILLSDSSNMFIGLDADSTYTFFVKAVCGEGDSSAIETLTVHTPTRPAGGAVIGEGTATNTYAPVYGTYCDNNQRSQSVYPADMLTALEGQTILELAYVVTYGGSVGTNGNWENATFNVRLGTTVQSNLSAGWATETLTDVYSGTLHASVEDGMHIVLNEPFTYNGGNLVIEFELPVKTGWSACTFQGITQTGGSRTMFGTSTAGTVRDFLPQVQFICATAGCEPTKLAASNITTSSADVTWFPGDKEMSWATLLSDSALTAQTLATLTADTVAEMKRHFDGLTADHDYYFYIRSLCQPEAGDWKEFVFQTAPTCLIPVALHADSIDSYAAHVVWTDPNESLAGNYTVAYGLKKEFNLLFDSTYATLSTTDTAALLTGLKANTEYSFAVRTDCGQGDLSRWSAVADFRTACGAETITKTYNYIMDFENALDSMPDCWSAIRNGGSNPFVKDYSYYAHGGTKYLTFGGYSGENKTQYAVLPAMANEMDSLRIKFWMAGYTSSSSYKNDSILVGVMSDPLDESTFVPVARFQAITDDYEEYEVQFDTYTGDGHYIAFKHVPVLAYASIYSSSYYGSYIDDVVVSLLPTCAKPANLVAEAAIDTALVTWKGGSLSYIVELSEGTGFAKIDTLMASDTALVLRNLKPGTTYSTRITGVCEDAVSDPSVAISFTTKIGLPFSEDFNASTSAPGSWTKLEGDLFDKPTASSYYGWKVSQLSEAGMTANHMYCGVYLKEDEWSYYDENLMYALVTPEINLNAADSAMVMLSFDIALTNADGTAAPSTAVAQNREFDVVISTDGGETWSRTNAYTWKAGGTQGTYTSISTTAMHVELDLSEYIGQSIKIAFFHSSGTSTSTTESIIYLDNVKLSEVNPNCLGIEDLQVSNVSFTGADVSFGYKAGATDAVIALSKNAVLNLDDVVLLDTITNDSSYILPPLDASTTYYVFVEQLCGEGETSAWEMTSFSTAYGVRYAPVFTSTTLPSDWKCYSGYADPIFRKDTTLVPYAGAWTVVASDTVMTGYHLRSEIYSTWNRWITTPQIDLTPNVGEGLLLSFDLALTAYSSSYEDKKLTGVDDQFMVVISQDGGLTWERSNATVWSNDSLGDYTLNDYVNNKQTVHLDLSRYAGKVIMIAFHQESTVSNTDNYIYVGNIVLDRVQTVNYMGDVCDGDDYDGTAEGNPFKIRADEYQVGINTYSIYVPADTTIEGSQDTMLVLNLMVNSPASYTYYATVCEGEHYQDANFDLQIKLNTPTTQRKTGLTTVSGCDSTIVLYLTINPIQRVDIMGLTCQGTPYHFGGKDIYLEGTYYDTTSSVITGCDSISILHLSYDKPSEDWLDYTLCYGDSMILADGTVVKTAGQYVERTTKVSGCDSIIHWNVLVADEFKVAYDTVDVTELPYFYNNKMLLDADASIGSHDVTISMSCGDGILRILVEQKTGLKEIMDKRKGVQKLIVNEQLIIISDGKIYNAQGGQL